MGDRIGSELKRLFADRRLFRGRISRGMILKEIEAARNDLQDAQDSLERKKFKWARIQAYSSIFHSARALLYHRGFRERSHYALLVAIRELFGNKLGRKLIGRFE